MGNCKLTYWDRLAFSHSFGTLGYKAGESPNQTHMHPMRGKGCHFYLCITTLAVSAVLLRNPASIPIRLLIMLWMWNKSLNVWSTFTSSLLPIADQLQTLIESIPSMDNNNTKTKRASFFPNSCSKILKNWPCNGFLVRSIWKNSPAYQVYCRNWGRAFTVCS